MGRFTDDRLDHRAVWEAHRIGQSSEVDPADLYRTLQVDPEAEFEVIRAAHRVLAAKHHPDVGGSAVQMAQINSAWTVLSDPVSRAAYDHQWRLHAGLDRWDAYRKAAQPAVQCSGTILDFGRYAGWSIPAIGQQDPDYLEWLVRTPNGRRFEHEIDVTLGRGPANGPTVDPMVRAHERAGRH
jgi:curved DNA-binding protein CbpA